MALLLSPPSWYGTRFGVCVYKLHGENRVRKASSLDGKRVKTAPEFKNTRIWAARMKEASRLAAAAYDMLPPSRRKFRFYRALTGQAMRLLKEGRGEGEVVVELMISIRLPKRVRKKKPVGKVVEKAQAKLFTGCRQRKQSALSIRKIPEISRKLWRQGKRAAIVGLPVSGSFHFVFGYRDLPRPVWHTLGI